jgi:hypothetical protein
MLRQGNRGSSLILAFLFKVVQVPRIPVSGEKVQKEPSGWYWDDSRKALAYGGGRNPATGKPCRKEVPGQEITLPQI